jgi:hypothetical protein
VKPSTASIDFTPAEREAAEDRQRQTQAALERIAAAGTLQEQQRIGDQVWAELIERPRASRRIEAARKPRILHQSRPTRPGRVTVKRRARAARTSTPSRGDPDDDPDEQTWALTFVDRAPVFWRLRALRCHLLEIREAVDR